MLSKQEARKQAKKLLSIQNMNQIENSIVKNLFLFDSFLLCIKNTSKTILSFMPINFEPNIAKINEFLEKSNKPLAFLKVESSEDMNAYYSNKFKTGSFGIQEPLDTSKRVNQDDIDMVLVPMLAYNNRGFRLGRGKGYYDRYLSKCKNAVFVGIALDNLCIDFEENKTDIKMDFIVTDKKIYKF